jgi:hypothetical protein
MKEREACIRDCSTRGLSPPFVSNMSRAQRGRDRRRRISARGDAAVTGSPEFGRGKSGRAIFGDNFLAKTEPHAIGFISAEVEPASRAGEEIVLRDAPSALLRTRGWE